MDKFRRIFINIVKRFNKKTNYIFNINKKYLEKHNKKYIIELSFIQGLIVFKKISQLKKIIQTKK